MCVGAEANDCHLSDSIYIYIYLKTAAQEVFNILEGTSIKGYYDSSKYCFIITYAIRT